MSPTCDLCGQSVWSGNLNIVIGVVLGCLDCLHKLQQPTRLDGCVTAGSWQSIDDAHMQAHDQWKRRMVQLAKDICGGEA